MTKINTATNGVTTLAVSVGKGPSSVAVSADNKYAYVTNSTDNTVTVITLSYNATKTITGVGTSPTGVVVGGDKVYVSSLGGTVSIISAASNTVTGQVTVGAPVRSLALSADGTQLFAATRSDTVVAIDVATATVVSTVTTDPTPDNGQHSGVGGGRGWHDLSDRHTDNALRILHMGTVTGPTNHAPVIGDPIVGTPNAQTGIVTGTIVASDADGDTLTYTVTTAPTSGAVSVGTNGSFTYTPTSQARQAADQNTVDHFTVTVSDGQASVTSAVTVKVLPAPAGGQPGLIVDGSVGTGGSPSGVAVSGDKVYVTNQAAGTMTVYKRSDNSVLATVPVGASPSAVVVNSAGTRAYVANSTAGTVTVINTTDYSVVTTIKVGSTPTSLALTPDGTRLVVTNAGSNTVSKINTATNGVTTLAIAVGKGPSSIAVSADNLYAYVTNTTDNTVTVITLSYNATKTITGVGNSPNGVVISGGKVYVSNLGGTVAVISAASNTVTGQVTVGAPVRSLALSSDGTRLFAATTTDAVVAIDIATATVTSTVTTDPTPDAISKTMLAVASDGTIYQTDSTDNALRILHVGIVAPNDPPTVGAPIVNAPECNEWRCHRVDRGFRSRRQHADLHRDHATDVRNGDGELWRNLHLHTVGEFPGVGRQLAWRPVGGPIRRHRQRRQGQRDLRRRGGSAPLGVHPQYRNVHVRAAGLYLDGEDHHGIHPPEGDGVPGRPVQAPRPHRQLQPVQQQLPHQWRSRRHQHVHR